MPTHALRRTSGDQGSPPTARLRAIEHVISEKSAGKPRVVFNFATADGKIEAIELIADPDRLSRLDVTILTS